MIHLIGFYTQGPPFDHAKDLSESKKRCQLLYENQVDVLKLYTTTHMMVKNSKFKDSISPVPNFKFLDGWTHHFCKWKPFVIQEHLKEMKQNDILVYQDGDILKHREFEKDVRHFKENVQSILVNTDLVCSIDTQYQKNKETTKEDVFLEFGNYQETKSLTTNRIFLRKTPKTVQFIANWVTLCNTSLLLPNFTEKHSYGESLFNVLYYKYIEMGEFTFPNIYFKDNLFSKETIYYLDKLNENIQKGDTLNETKKPVVVRRMLPPHQSTRSSTMSLIPIAKPNTNFIRKPPPSFFTLNRTR